MTLNFDAHPDLPLADGPGIFTDEASSALPDLRHRLDAATYRVLAEVTGASVPPPDPDAEPALALHAPGESGLGPVSLEDDDAEDALVTLEALVPLAALVTGVWGPMRDTVPARALAPETTFADLTLQSSGVERRRLTVLRAPTTDTAEPMPTEFFARMRALRSRLDAEIERLPDAYAAVADRSLQRARDAVAKAQAAYDAHPVRKTRDRLAQKQASLATARAKKRALRPAAATALRPWIDAVTKMRDAVVFALEQESQIAQGTASVLKRDAKGHLLPLGLPWGVLAASGNKKLPFVAYSELPMATCLGAGACAVAYDYPARRRAYETEKKAHFAAQRAHLAEAKARFKDTSATWSKDARTEAKAALDERKANLQRDERTYDRKAPHKGWCYSFKAWRYPAAFARQFLNTLASALDRELAIRRAGGSSDPVAYGDRVAAGVRGTREWQDFVACEVLVKTRAWRAAKQAPSFFRLFVDGDIGHEDTIVAWMHAIAAMGAEGASGSEVRCRAAGHEGKGDGTPLPHVEVYGYSKCWNQLLNADRMLGGQWPANYTLNLSSGSVYADKGDRHTDIRVQVERLPIARGYFEAVPLDQYIPKLRAQTEALRHDPNAPVPRLDREKLPAEFSEDRIRMFFRLNGIGADLRKPYDPAVVDTVLADARAVVGDTLTMPGRWKHAPVPPPRARTEASPWRHYDHEAADYVAAVRHAAMHHWLTGLLRTEDFGAMVRRELAKDDNPDRDKAWFAAYEKAAAWVLREKGPEGFVVPTGTGERRMTLSEEIVSGWFASKRDVPTRGEMSFSEKKLVEKAMALTLHEVLWTLGLGGSCPLVCGNCSDDPTNEAAGVHRCASKGAFRGATIHIGLH